MATSVGGAHIMAAFVDAVMTARGLPAETAWRIAPGARGIQGGRQMGCGRITGAALWLTAAMLGAGPIAAAQEAQTGRGTNELSFLAADTDGDTLIDEAELGADQAKRFGALDANGDGYLEAGELETPDGVMFAAVDKDADGKLSFVEVMSAKMDDFTAADGNGDGRVSFEEVMAFESKQ
jgi:EF hand